MTSPKQYYDEQKTHYSLLLTAAIKDYNRIANLRLWVGISAIAAGIWAIREMASWQWWLTAALVATFLYLVRIHTALSEKRLILELHIKIIDDEINSLAGNNSAFADGGKYADAKHPYSFDLDIFGKASVFQSLCRTVSAGGAYLLANRLSLLTLEKETIIARQAIVSELSRNPDLLQQFRVAGCAATEGPDDQTKLKTWLLEPEMFLNNLVVSVSAILMPALSVVFICWSFYTRSLFPGLTIVFITNWILLLLFKKKIKLAAMQLGKSAKLIAKFENLMQQVAVAEFEKDWLKTTGNHAAKSVGNITRLKKIIKLFESRENNMTGPLMNGLFLFDFYCLLQLEQWRSKHKQLLLTTIENMVELDVYVSCAVYAFNHPENVYPAISNGSEISAKDLKHPLLDPATAIGNDVSLGCKEQFYLLTGANMTGKSTFIRTIGVSNVLTNLGLPLPAASVSMPIMDLYTSMRITDSVQDDISYFRAELNRIRAMMDFVSKNQHVCLVLLDEPLRGTNSTDKQQGTRAIIETLLSYNAAGIVATHDTGLCDMESGHTGKISNYYFESSVSVNGLIFDFKLRQGGSTSNNATILMRQMGIIK
jgi:hypothetical protein